MEYKLIKNTNNLINPLFKLSHLWEIFAVPNYNRNLFKYPSKVATLQTEIKQHIKGDEDITIDNIKQLHYLEWVQKEALRMCSPSGGIVERKVLRNITIGDIPI